MQRIKQFELESTIFDQILYDFQSDIKLVPSTDPYIHGYKNKNDIYYDSKEYIICKEYILNYYCNNITDCTEWKQCRIRRVENTNVEVSNSIDGQSAWEFMIRLLEHWYTWEEIVEIFNSYKSEYDEGYAQYHYIYPIEVGELREFDNCYKYDINGAHNDALVEMFPKAKKSILKLYDERHSHPGYKKLVNFFVGMLTRKGFRETYNWIVQRTTRILYKAMDMTGGYLVYANTDGYVISAPNNLIGVSNKLGDFKLEYTGSVFVYIDKNYWLIQCGDDMKGSCLKEVRNCIDLRKGNIVHYDIKRIKIGEKENGDPIYIRKAENIKKEIKTWQKVEL